MNVIFKQISNEVDRRMNAMIKGATKLDAVINRYVFPMYQQAQAERWKSENQSEGKKWKNLSPRYLAWKRKAKTVGGEKILRGGNSILVLTGKLAQAAIVKNKWGSKLVERGKLKITITLPYASKVNEERDFITFSQETKDRMKEVIRKAILNGGA